MTRLLQQAMERVTQLSDEQQDTIASIILQELEHDLLWDEVFANSQNELAKWEERVEQDIRAGHVRKMGIDQL